MTNSGQNETEIYNEVLARMLSHPSLSGFDKRQSSVCYTVLAPAALEIAAAYVKLHELAENSYADTGDLDSLIRRAKEFGLEYKKAEKSVILARIDSDNAVPVGERFSCGDVYFSVTAAEDGNCYKLTAEEVGSAGNIESGKLLYLGYLGDIRSAEIISVEKYGSDDETLEDFRARFFDYVKNRPFCGNKAAYREAVSAIPGVGGCKIARPTADSKYGNITVTVTDTSYGIPDYELIEKVQSAVDPFSDGDGNGFAPICHSVFISAVQIKRFTAEVKIRIKYGYDMQTVSDSMSAAADGVVRSVGKAWAERGVGILRKSAIFSELLKTEGVEDITEIALKDENGVQYSSVEFGGTELPKLTVAAV